MSSSTPKLIEDLQEIDNKASRAVEVWLDNILEGYITEFVVDINKSFKHLSSAYHEVDYCCLCSHQLNSWSAKKVF